ncbi:MAG: hypothetical protein HOO06_01700 [Bdellovibrionaceae bacterium]|jgi:hypothetical protein|nr:hypothetical protein [Pseudobdellovibrionaceae bacterium]
MKKILVLLSVFLFSQYSLAGIVELSLGNSYIHSKINAVNYTEGFSTTASFSYYFMAMSALEFSYTEGKKTQAVGSDVNAAPEIYTFLTQSFGLDLVYSFATRESQLQPFVKMGMAKRYKETFYKPASGLPKTSYAKTNGEVPSMGLGFRLKLSQAFSLKVSADAWGSNPDEKFSDWDLAARIGLSWYL